MLGRYNQISFGRLPRVSQMRELRDLWNRIQRAHGDFRAAEVVDPSSQGSALRELIHRAGRQVHSLDRRKFEGGSIQMVLQSPRDPWRVYLALLWIADQLQVQ